MESQTHKRVKGAWSLFLGFQLHWDGRKSLRSCKVRGKLFPDLEPNGQIGWWKQELPGTESGDLVTGRPVHLSVPFHLQGSSIVRTLLPLQQNAVVPDRQRKCVEDLERKLIFLCCKSWFIRKLKLDLNGFPRFLCYISLELIISFCW